MNNPNFVAAHAEHIRRGDKCPSRKGYAQSGAHIYCEHNAIDGTSYLQSYGAHYPLLYPITTKSGGRLLVVNRRGYSNSTSKHINYASAEADVWAYASDIRRDAAGVLEHLHAERARRQAAYDILKRKDTKKAAFMLSDMARIDRDIMKINN